jgi:hypothetical protein
MAFSDWGGHWPLETYATLPHRLHTVPCDEASGLGVYFLAHKVRVPLNLHLNSIKYLQIFENSYISFTTERQEYILFRYLLGKKWKFCKSVDSWLNLKLHLGVSEWRLQDWSPSIVDFHKCCNILLSQLWCKSHGKTWLVSNKQYDIFLASIIMGYSKSCRIWNSLFKNVSP